jgi:hypothetical protein
VQFLGGFIKIAEFNPAFSGEEVWMHARGLACVARKRKQLMPLWNPAAFLFTPQLQTIDPRFQSQPAADLPDNTHCATSHRFRGMQGIEN